MKIITSTEELRLACDTAANYAFCTVDTEFLRESTFWPVLCLIQLACKEDEWIIDVQADGIDLEPFFELMANKDIIKVFHAARQDVEIIYNLAGLIPSPIFDTQIAAMVCGYGDSISYDQLVYKVTGQRLDKSSRFTDWSKRPLSDKQLTYALADVTHLRDVYLSVNATLNEQDRSHWLSEEMEILTSPETYDMPPEHAWKRLKMRARKPRELEIMKRVAQWREETAREYNLPRGRVIRDDAIYDIAARGPNSIKQLCELRSLSRGFDKSRYGEGLVAAIAAAKEVPNEHLPKLPRPKQMPEGCAAATEMLKVLLKYIVEKHGVAAKIIATVDDLEKIAADDKADVPALKGWRKELFGKRALELKNGRIALGYRDREVQVIKMDC
ncbi:MAG: ribonuclease D [Pseudomonadota bacterium]